MTERCGACGRFAPRVNDVVITGSDGTRYLSNGVCDACRDRLATVVGSMPGGGL